LRRQDRIKEKEGIELKEYTGNKKGENDEQYIRYLRVNTLFKSTEDCVKQFIDEEFEKVETVTHAGISPHCPLSL
jgi:hypothetical protein